MISSRSLISMLMLATMMAIVVPAHAQPSADEVLAATGFSADEQQRILAGELVSHDLKGVSERDLSVSMGFIVKLAPDDLAKQIMAGTLSLSSEQRTARGDINGTGTLEDFAGLRLVPGGRALAKTYLDASAGDKLNLATDEIAAFHALQGESDATQAVEQQLRKLLLARYQSYRSSGLDGIPPYDRGGKRTDPATDLRKASEAPLLKKFFPAAQRFLVDYPKATLPGLTEAFFWANNRIDDQPTYALIHLLSTAEGAARMVIERQFYAGRSYNAAQAIVGLLPIQQGTLVVYGNHTFTDQVTGFGGSAKQSIGRHVMGSRLKDLFEKVRTAAVTQ